jgi:hypothetical protein
MHRAGLRDVPTLVRVVGVAFTRERGGQSSPRDRRARAVVTWFGELSAVIAREAYVGRGGDVVVHVGRRGGWYSLRARASAAALLLAGVLLPAAVIGAIVTAATTSAAGTVAAAAAFLAAYCVVIGGAIVAHRQQQRRHDGPGLREAEYRKGLPRTYWTVTTLAAADGATATAIPAVRSWLPTVVPVGATVVAAAADADVRRLYVALRFRPLPGSEWVLSRVNLPDQSPPTPR